MPISPMIRTAIITGDLDRSRRFYEELLGLTDVYWEGELNDPSLWHLLGTPDGSHCRAVILKVPGSEAYGMVGLFELSNPKPPALPAGGAQARVGEGVSVFYYDDLDFITDNTARLGGTVCAAPNPLVHEGRVKQREMVLRDPDGYLINLIEWDPDNPLRPELQPGAAPD